MKVAGSGCAKLDQIQQSLNQIRLNDETRIVDSLDASVAVAAHHQHESKRDAGKVGLYDLMRALD